MWPYVAFLLPLPRRYGWRWFAPPVPRYPVSPHTLSAARELLVNGFTARQCSGASAVGAVLGNLARLRARIRWVRQRQRRRVRAAIASTIARRDALTSWPPLARARHARACQRRAAGAASRTLASAVVGELKLAGPKRCRCPAAARAVALGTPVTFVPARERARCATIVDNGGPARSRERTVDARAYVLTFSSSALGAPERSRRAQIRRRSDVEGGGDQPDGIL